MKSTASEALCRGLMIVALAGFANETANAYPDFREAFFAAYPGAVGTILENAPSHSFHCGVCHYDFSGGGQRNPYGVLVQAALPGFPDTPAGYQQAILSVANTDAEGDGYKSVIELTDLVSFPNTPTFPGLSLGNVGLTAGVDQSDILSFLTPGVIVDTTPPDVTVISPNGGETATGNQAYTVTWTATDDVAVSSVEIRVSYNNGVAFETVAAELPNTGSHAWFAANRPTSQAIIHVIATDTSGNAGDDLSDAVFTIQSPPGGIIPTTLRDFDQPGSQPFEAGSITHPQECGSCHGFYDQSVEPYFNWRGGMMAHAARDPLFEAAMTVANQDAPDSGDLCLRCHIPTGWVRGRSVPTDGSEMLASDKTGVSCDFCHRLVDPFYDALENPPQDPNILNALAMPPSELGNGMYVLDPTGLRRGPYDDADLAHTAVQSPFHREAALCGTCHDVSNPALEWNGVDAYVPNELDQPASDFSPHTLMPLERTYSEWLNSEYNTIAGVYAPQFGGNKDYVSTCQDCHMRDVTGQGCVYPNAPVRTDLPLHDLTGGSTWLPSLLPGLYPGEVDAAAIADAIDRARYMLQNAASMRVSRGVNGLRVRVTNETGHKLPTGYPEGRRMWLNVRFYDAGGALLNESGAYDPNTAVLSEDAEAKVYEIKIGPDDALSELIMLKAEPSFHFVLNNKVYKDNRIPPRGFTNAAYASFGGGLIGASYADGQHWDDSLYQIPSAAASAEVTLYYQSTSKEYVEFLRDENTTDTKGQDFYDLWANNGKCPPEVMASQTIVLRRAMTPADSQKSAAQGRTDKEPIIP